MRIFVGWIKEGEEHKRAFENSSAVKMGSGYLHGRWKTIRKVRLVRLIRRVIEEGIIVKGVKELYEEGCRLLSEIEKGRTGGEGEEGEEEEEERYMYELYLLRVRGEQKKLKENEVLVLRREMEALRREVGSLRSQLQEEKSKTNEEKKRADREKQLKEQATIRANTEQRKREESEAEKRLLTFPQNDGIKREGALIIHHGPDQLSRNCFIGGVMTSV